MIRRLLVVILLAAPLHAQEARKTDTIPRFNRRAFVAGVSLPIEEHARFAVCNAGIDPRSLVVQSCPLGF